MANSHFRYLAKKLADRRHDQYLLDAQVLTQQKPVALHKLVLAIFSSHIRESNKNSSGQWEVSADGYGESDIENLVEFLYDGDVEIGVRVTEIIKSLHLDLCVDQRIRKKKVSKGESVQNVVNLELKYLRNLVFEMEIPKLLKDTRLCSDVTIRIGTKLYVCHKIMLAAMSSYFQVMFTSGMKEETDKVITVQGIEPETFSTVLNYIYTGKNPLNISNAQDLLLAAVYLQVETLQNLCEEFLLMQIDTSNCVDIWKLGTAYNCSLLANGAWKFLVENYNNINHLKLQRNMNVTDVQNLLREDNLNINDEKEVLQFALGWVSNNDQPENLGKLLLEVRLSLVDRTYLEEILKSNKLVKSQVESQKLIQNALKEKNTNTLKGDSTCNPRKEKVFVVLKRSSMLSGVEVGCYSLLQKKWYTMEPNTKCAGGTGFSTCSTEDSIYMSGGTSIPYSFYKFSLSENKWTQLADMTTGRHSHATGFVDGAVYVLGGSGVSSEAFTVLQSIEKYDIKQTCWTKVGNMEIPTYDSAFTTIKSRVYTFGGSIGSLAGVYVKDIQCFDTITQTCTKLYHNLPFTLSLAMACSSNRDVYITCPNGKMIHYNEDSAPSTINETKGSQLMGFATLYHQNAIYIMGGYSMIGETDAIHKFDLNTKKQVKVSQFKLPFKKETNQLFASSMHVSRKFLTNEYMTVEESMRKNYSPRWTNVRN
ncbi:ectoderm-neural cortex protein 1-like [Mercenaria mercenaria]|uniref:ectoderm-neural cortex protein 1-like n=1 Tax=Mercenaria mercenaria TaxID=6596 RepID=UPI00234EEC75|nr:ectoderm-neural cortex protein 1-like [Mercenaria mercenaria]